jgi:sigma-B regulation protein RsbU (phosphoserine phosphatase)
MKRLYTLVLPCLIVFSLVSCKTLEAGARLQSQKRHVEKVLPKLARKIQTVPHTSDAITVALENYLRENPEAYGAAFAVDPARGGERFSAYVYRRKGRFVRMDLDDKKYNYPAQEWYARPKQLKHAVWSPPYFDEGAGDIRMITYSIPVYTNGRFWGIITTDLAVGK